MKRILITLVAAAMLLALAVPAIAKPRKDNGPKPPLPETYLVTMEAVSGAEGLATTCSGPLTMAQTDGHLQTWGDTFDPATSVPELMLTMNGVEWWRTSPEPATGIGFAGCHGPGVTELYGVDGNLIEAALNPGYFRITPVDGAGVYILWILDIYQREDEVQRGKKVRSGITVREDLRLVANATWVEWDPTTTTTGLVTGQFGMTHFIRGELAPYGEDAYFDGSPRDFEFILTVEPIG